MNKTNDTLSIGEIHPSAHDAMDWYKEFVVSDVKRWMIIQESIASTALSGNRLAEVMFGTVERLKKGEPVSDRYLLGLCWYLIRNHNENGATNV